MVSSERIERRCERRVALCDLAQLAHGQAEHHDQDGGDDIAAGVNSKVRYGGVES
jgi:hypothetical protein